MSPTNKDLGRLLRLIAEIADSDQPELISFIYNSARSARANFGKTNKNVSPHTEKAFQISDEDISRLEQYESREQLGVFLKATYQRKSELETIARTLKLSVNKTLNYDDIVEKIIDASIGYKLRSRAIRGE